MKMVQMNKLEQRHQEVVGFLTKNSDEKIIAFLSRYFKEGLDAYGIEKEVFKTHINQWMELWAADMTIDDYLDFGDMLIATGKLEEGSIAFHGILSKRSEFTRDTFDRVGKWLENGIQNWASTDVLCMMVLIVFINDNVVQPKDFEPWTTSASKWKRRAVPVTFVEAIKQKSAPEPILSVIERLMEDPEEDVQKGLGTLLREIWKKQPALAEEFLMQWKDRSGRKIIQYATEKMDKAYRTKFKKE